MGRLEGKVAIVTGGARGIGGATARMLVEEGARVLIADVLVGEGEALQFGAIYGMQAVFAGMVRSGGGSIINTSSIAGLRGWGSNVGYAATKGALLAIGRTIAIEWAEYGIRVNTVLPGAIDTPMARGAVAPELSNLDQRVAAQVPLKRAGTVEKVAAAMTYLASEESAFCTGLELVIDGGQTIGRRRRTVPPSNRARSAWPRGLRV